MEKIMIMIFPVVITENSSDPMHANIYNFGIFSFNFSYLVVIPRSETEPNFGKPGAYLGEQRYLFGAAIGLYNKLYAHIVTRNIGYRATNGGK